MASYNDIGTIPYWKGLEKGEHYQGICQPMVHKAMPKMR